MADTRTTPSSLDATSAADEKKDADDGRGGVRLRAPVAGHESLLEGQASDVWPRGAAVLRDAEDAAADSDAECGADTVEAVETVIGKHPLSLDESLAALRPSGGGDGSTSFFFRMISAPGDSYHVARAWAEVFAAALPPAKMTEACTAGFVTCCAPDPRRFLCGISVFFAYGAKVEPRDLIGLAAVLTMEELKGVFLGGVACVDNPFIPGVSLSVALTEALKNSAETERPILAALQECVDGLILEILERLPQTIDDFPGGVKGCEDIFEPEIAGIVRDSDFRGPLTLALHERQFSKTLCVASLMHEYMSYRFVAGLPNVQDSNNLLGRPKKEKANSTAETTAPTSTSATAATTTAATAAATASAASAAATTITVVTSLPEHEGRKGRDFLYNDGFVAGSKVGKLMQGLGWTGRRTKPNDSDNRLTVRDLQRIFTRTVLPGFQFITIGVLTEPEAYYKVPAVRMALSFYVHLVMLALYTTVVLEDDDGELSNTEIVLTFYVMAEIVSNLVQIWDNFFEYIRNRWNWLECLSLTLLAGGLFVRVVDSDEHIGRGLFALSAPLVFSRVLFFGQILRRQGLVIQMMAILFGEMLQFALVLGTIMMGFTVSFFALFNEEQSYGECWLDVFKAMLGEVGVFEDLYEDSVYRNVAKVLLVMYLLVVGVMLLNLLIAVLSTEHAKVDQQQDRAFRESKVQLMKLYGRIVEGDQLPTPFNLVQLVLWLPFRVLDSCIGVHTSAKVVHEFGVGIAWLMLGPPALLAAWGLWVASVPTAVVRVWRRANFTGKSLTFAVVCSSGVVALHTLVLPIVAFLLWVRSGLDLMVTVFRELGASLCGNDDATRGGNAAGESGEQQRRARRGVGSGAVNDGVGNTSVAQILKDAGHDTPPTSGRRSSFGRGGDGGRGDRSGLSVAKIVAYLEDPETSERREQEEQPATWEQVARMRNHLHADGKGRSEAVLARLARVDADLKASIVELVEQSVASGVERGLRDGLEETVAAMVEGRVGAELARRKAPPQSPVAELSADG
eukprot:g9014.t1